MQQLALTNPEVFPTEKEIKKHLSDSFKFFKKILDYTHNHIENAEEVWNFYRDGRSWLLRIMKKSKNYYWVGIYEGYFNVTFYLNSASEKRIRTSNIPENLKLEYENTKDRKVRWISFPVRDESDIEIFKNLLAIKTRIKMNSSKSNDIGY